MKPVKIQLKVGHTALFAACITLLISGCGGEEPQAALPAEPEGAPANTPEVLPATLEIKNHEKTYVINGIGMSGTNTMAIINNDVVRPGMELASGAFVRDIQPTYAIIVVNGKQHLLRPEDIQREMDRKNQ
jgi:hypothetical protein